MRIGYKVVSRMMTSVYAEEAIKYKLHHKIRPRRGYGPLAVFEHLKDAVHFHNSFMVHGDRIFKCRYSLSRSRKLWEWIEGLGYRSKIIKQNHFPRGTGFAASVILDKEIYEEKVL